MQSFTKAEIAWVAKELSDRASQMRAESERTEASNLDAGMTRLRADQYVSIADRLSRAIQAGNKRLEIKY